MPGVFSQKILGPSPLKYSLRKSYLCNPRIKFDISGIGDHLSLHAGKVYCITLEDAIHL